MRLLCVVPFAFLQLALAGALAPPPNASPGGALPAIPAKEALNYSVEWRLVHAGNARLNWSASDAGRPGWQSNMYLESIGLVSKLFKVNNSYNDAFDGGMCVQKTLFDINEGSRKREVAVTFDTRHKKAHFIERDLAKNQTVADAEIDTQACEHDIIGALYELRTMNVEIGHSVGIPVSDGKKSVVVRVQAEERETIKTDWGTYNTIRYEAFVFDGVVYRRSGKAFVWLTDDNRRLPVQIRVRLPIYIGTVTLQLENPGKK
ncbi:MAG: DUF3108 domain-containing protein [Bryobacteraceae bacterium]